MAITLLDKICAYKARPNPLKRVWYGTRTPILQSGSSSTVPYSGLIKEYEEYIKDISVPLDERWEIFRIAPNEFKRHETYIVRFQCEKMLSNGRIHWYNDLNHDKYQTVYMISLLEYLTELDDLEYTGEFIQALKEEILQMNLGSFINYW